MSEPDPGLFHASEPHHQNLAGKLNWLRAGVLGANDGIVSVAGVVVGVAGASGSLRAIFTAGTAALVAGAFSMAGGEYVSVSTQRDTERAALVLEQRELRETPEAELAELATLYEQQGLSSELARQVAAELTAGDPLTAHVRLELGFDPADIVNPWAAAVASLFPFAIGAVIPLGAIMLPVGEWRILLCFVATVIGMMLTGYISARLGRAPAGRAVIRNAGVGVLTMMVTLGVGRLFGDTVG